ncbi:glutaredoxin family protein [Alkalihalobacillus pseudalcaliphilus]|uniref:glutaredoxin family protein n=1 Tax=Alkalihalobacillus pseudalcaliphilus TaxID=79884 RepID=UPI00064DDFD9|nr:glutaredoxin family protein [Alkalihalobacillus pseudalcaliphilus]KMK74619.1 glutaredoxin [Alkalihalobacillus pseudalcaliphilus]
MIEKMIVYSTVGCVECGYVKNLLEQEEVAYEVRDVMESEQYQQEVEKFGFMGVPVTVFREQAVKGFNPDLRELIEAAKK